MPSAKSSTSAGKPRVGGRADFVSFRLEHARLGAASNRTLIPLVAEFILIGWCHGTCLLRPWTLRSWLGTVLALWHNAPSSYPLSLSVNVRP